jgi:DNA repair protein RadC
MMKTSVQVHVIITEHSYYSFANNGLMQELERSTRYIPTFELEERYKKEMTKMLQEAAIQQREVRKESRQEGLQQGEAKGLEKGAKQRTIAIARQMLQEGLEEKLISRVTGMSVQQIGRLKSSID